MLKALFVVLSTSYISWFVQNHERQVVYPFSATYSAPADTRLQERKFRTADGETLILWHAPAPGTRPTVLYFPGNAGTLADRTKRFQALIDRGFGVMAMAYRGSSGSSGMPDEVLLTEDATAVAALLGERPVILYGESLGAAVAVKLAAAGLGEGVVLEAPFLSIPEIVASQYPSEPISEHFTQVWDSGARIEAVRQRLLILHGTEDRLVPFAHGVELHARASSAEKSLVALKGHGHTGLWTQDAQHALFLFLSQSPGCSVAC